jgi:hypothetical protein
MERSLHNQERDWERSPSGARALTPWHASDPVETTFQRSFSQQKLISPLIEKGTWASPSKTQIYRRTSKVFEQTGLMIGQQLNSEKPILKRDAQEAWKEQLTKDLEVKRAGPLTLPRKEFERRPFTPWLYGQTEQTVGNSGLTQEEFLARGAEVRERLRQDRSDLVGVLNSEFADLPLIERRHRIAQAGGKAANEHRHQTWLDIVDMGEP